MSFEWNTNHQYDVDGRLLETCWWVINLYKYDIRLAHDTPGVWQVRDDDWSCNPVRGRLISEHDSLEKAMAVVIALYNLEVTTS